MKQYRTLVILVVMVLLVMGVAAVQDVQAKTSPALKDQYGVVPSGDLAGPISTAITISFPQAYSAAPVCTISDIPTTLLRSGETGSRFSVTMMQVNQGSLVVFIDNPHASVQSTVIHWRCIGR